MQSEELCCGCWLWPRLFCRALLKHVCLLGIEDMWSRGCGCVGKRASPYGGKVVLVSSGRCAAGLSIAVPVWYRWGLLVAAVEHYSWTPDFPVATVILDHVVISVCRWGPKATSHSQNSRWILPIIESLIMVLIAFSGINKILVFLNHF